MSRLKQVALKAHSQAERKREEQRRAGEEETERLVTSLFQNKYDVTPERFSHRWGVTYTCYFEIDGMLASAYRGGNGQFITALHRLKPDKRAASNASFFHDLFSLGKAIKEMDYA